MAEHFDNGTEKLSIEFSSRLGGTIGINYRSSVDEVVIFMKKHASLTGVRKGSDIDGAIKKEIVDYTLELRDSEDTPDIVEKILNMLKSATGDGAQHCTPHTSVTGWMRNVEGTSLKIWGSKALMNNSRSAKFLLTSCGMTVLLNFSILNDARTQVTNKETEQGGPVSDEERNTIFQNSYRSSLGCGASQAHGRGYMAKPHSVSGRLRTQIDEHARVTIQTQRQNQELNYHVQNLENRNRELTLHVQGLEAKNKELNVQLQSLGNKNDELNLQVQNLESQLETDRA